MLHDLLHYLLHIDIYLFSLVSTYGLWTYVFLFLIIFCETGLVITPFLPGDSLLFAAGSIAAHSSQALNINVLIASLIIASILGNKLNYLIGYKLGLRLFSSTSKGPWRLLFSNKHLEQTQHFYAKHGGKTIIFARFIPIIRTFAPFVAGIGKMKLKQFSLYNLLSAVLWIGSLAGGGYFFGTLPFVKNHFSLVVYGIIAVSLLPPLLTFMCRSNCSST
jgi:membrane-associated protein